MHKLIRPNLIHRVSRHPVSQTETSFVSSTNINFLESSKASFPLSVCICTLLHNDESKYDQIITTIRSIQSLFHKSFVVFVESNSTDNTVELYSKIDNSLFIHLENAAEHAQRNAYLSFVNKNRRQFDCMMVLDTSIVSKPLDKHIFSCLESDRYIGWDAVFANQSYKYYDIKSLRSKQCPTDFTEFPEDVRSQKIRNCKIHIPSDEKPIPVISAFGGLAIYKVAHLEKCEYKNDGHVSFNVMFNQSGGSRMFIEPSLVLETLEENAHLYL